jgi:2,4-dichlorophenol 6-monooxygenase
VAKQIVTRANQSIGEFGPIFEALGLTESTDPEVMQANMDKRCDATARPSAARGNPRGHRLQEVRVRRPRRRDEPALQILRRGHRRSDGARLRTRCGAALPADDMARGPAAPCLGVTIADGGKHSTLDLVGKGKFTVLTG